MFKQRVKIYIPPTPLDLKREGGLSVGEERS